MARLNDGDEPLFCSYTNLSQLQFDRQLGFERVISGPRSSRFQQCDMRTGRLGPKSSIVETWNAQRSSYNIDSGVKTPEFGIFTKHRNHFQHGQFPME